MSRWTVFVLAALIPTAAHAQSGPASLDGSCLERVRALDPAAVDDIGSGDINRGMEQAQMEEVARLKGIAAEHARRGDEGKCVELLTTINRLLVKNRQQLPTQQGLATGQVGSPGLERALEEAEPSAD